MTKQEQEMLEKLKDDMIKATSQYTFSFAQESDQEQLDRFQKETAAMLKHYFGEEMKLSPEQQKKFIEYAQSQPMVMEFDVNKDGTVTPVKENPNMLHLTIEMDPEGRLSFNFHK